MWTLSSSERNPNFNLRQPMNYKIKADLDLFRREASPLFWRKTTTNKIKKKSLRFFFLLLYTCRFFQLKSPPSFTIRTKSFERFKQNLWISLKKITIFSFFFLISSSSSSSSSSSLVLLYITKAFTISTTIDRPNTGPLIANPSNAAPPPQEPNLLCVFWMRPSQPYHHYVFIIDFLPTLPSLILSFFQYRPRQGPLISGPAKNWMRYVLGEKEN